MLTRCKKGRSSSRSLWMFIAGAAGGVLVSRVLPPFAAQASGAVRAAAGRDPFETLIRQHRELLSLLDRMEAAPADSPVRRIALLLRFKRTIAKHALAEEDIVYPLLHDDAGRADATKQLYDEHADMKIHLFELQRSVKNQEAWLKHLEALRSEIERHARQEEEVEFPHLRSQMDEAKTSRLARKIQQEEALIL